MISEYRVHVTYLYLYSTEIPVSANKCERCTDEVKPVLRLTATVADENLAADVLEHCRTLLEVHQQQTLELRLGAPELVVPRAIAHTHELVYHRLHVRV